MGLKKGQNNGKFLGVTNGRISLRVPEGTEGAVERKITRGVNEGKSVYELFFDSVDGYIVGGEVSRKEVNGSVIESIVIKIKDGKEIFNLNIPWNSKMRDSFVKVLPNLDVSKRVEIVVFPDKTDKSAVLLVKQDGESLPWFYTRSNQNGLPEPVRRLVKGVEKWDFSSTETFLWDKCSEFFEQFKNGSPEFQEEVVEEGYQEESFGDSSDDEDIPF